jgi:hypothetical protein
LQIAEENASSGKQEITTLRAQLEHERETGMQWYTACESWEDREATACPDCIPNGNNGHLTFEEYIEQLQGQLAQLTQDRDRLERVAKMCGEAADQSNLKLAAARQEIETLRAELETVRTQWRERSRGPI